MTDDDAGDQQARRAWLDRERDDWVRSFVGALDDAIQHLQQIIFDEGWDRLVAEYGDEESALRESVRHYERGLAHLFGFVRACGTLADDVAWSSMKTEYRRSALDAGVELTLRSALETGLYAAEQAPLGGHDVWLAWTDALMLFLYQCAASAPPHPGPAASQDDELLWAYDVLQQIEEHDAFHAALAAYLADQAIGQTVETLTGEPVAVIVEHEARLLSLQRFDLILNTGLAWLAGAAARTPIDSSD